MTTERWEGHWQRQRRAYVTVAYQRRRNAYTVETTMEPGDRIITDRYSLDEALQQHWRVIPVARLSRMMGKSNNKRSRAAAT